MRQEDLQERLAGIDRCRAREQDALIEEFLDALERGLVRAAEPCDGTWRVNEWVKRGILAVFRISRTEPAGEASFASFFDRRLLPTRRFAPDDGVRLVPGGSAVRRGAYVGKGVVIMPPAYVNVGAHVGEGTMIDSHALVGSCAQIGARVHLSAGSQIGGVLEPVGARPVIVEDEVLVGGNCGIYEGVLVRRHAVVGAGVVLTSSIPVFDVVHERILRGSAETPLEIPEGAVLVPGTRAMRTTFAQTHGLGLACALIVKYRDVATDARVALEGVLRGT